MDPCANGEVASISESTELLVHGSMCFPCLLLRSTDDGKTWSDVGLPRDPFAAATDVAAGQLTLHSIGAPRALGDGPNAR